MLAENVRAQYWLLDAGENIVTYEGVNTEVDDVGTGATSLWMLEPLAANRSLVVMVHLCIGGASRQEVQGRMETLAPESMR